MIAAGCHRSHVSHRIAERGRFLPGVVGSGWVTLDFAARKVAEDLVFLPADATLPKVLLQSRRSIADRPGDLEIHVLRYELEALGTRDLVVLGIGDISQEASQRWAFHGFSPVLVRARRSDLTPRRRTHR